MSRIHFLRIEGGRDAINLRKRLRSDRPELTSAKIVVSGGRALQNSENVHAVIEPLILSDAPVKSRRIIEAACPSIFAPPGASGSRASC